MNAKGPVSALLISAWLVGCGVPKDKYFGDVGRLRTQIDDLRSQKTSALRKALDLERQVAAMSSKGAQLNEGLRKALDRIAKLEDLAARQRQIFERLRSEFDALVKSGVLTVSVIRGQFTVQLANKVLFDSGKSVVKTEGEETLREVTRILAGLKDRFYQVAGHTDTDGGVDFNWRLSGRRSLAVIALMIKEGMPPGRISYAGYGAFHPTASNDTPEGKALNRRIEIILLPDMEAFMAPLYDNAPKAPPFKK